jgi:hypothetical protein
MYHPVLPNSSDDRLIFCLYRTCAESGSQEQCHQETVLKRALTGTWVVDEVRLAVERGYSVLKIHEFYGYEVTQYDPKTGEGGHFVQYIDTFMELKVENSGYPNWVQGSEDEDKHVQYFRDSEGSALDKAAKQKNACREGSGQTVSTRSVAS